MEPQEIKLTKFEPAWLWKNPKSYRITPSGEQKEIAPKDGKMFTVDEMYEHCGTDIVEFVYLPFNRILVVDEEGALKKDRKPNWIATKIVADVCELMGNTLDYFIYGNVMLIKDTETD